MHITSTERICGMPATELRSFFRYARDLEFDEKLFTDRLGVEPDAAARLARRLAAEGWIVRRGHPDEALQQRYEVADKARRLALATFARPLLRSTAERKLGELLGRVRAVNREARFLYRVERVLLFGSMLTEAERVSDIDLAIRLSPKPGTPVPWWTGSRRIQEAVGEVRSFGSIVDLLSWPQAVVLRFLKSRSRAFSFHDPNDAVLERVETRQIFP